VAASRSIHGCALAFGLLAAARAATNCEPICTSAGHGLASESRGDAPFPSVRATGISPASASASACASSMDPASSVVTMFVASSAGANASPSPICPVTFSTSFMKRVSRDPPSRISPLPPSRIPADKERLNASTESMPSSIVPFDTKLMMRTGRTWPMRWMRAMRCSRTAGFHGRSMFTSVDACCRLSPVLTLLPHLTHGIRHRRR